MRWLRRLDVSPGMAFYLLLGWVFCRAILPVIAETELFGCGIPATDPAFYTAEGLREGWLGWRLVLIVLATAWMETQARPRPWFKWVLRLSGPIWLASIILPVWIIIEIQGSPTFRGLFGFRPMWS